jgi:hypothetical protein
LRLLEPTGGSSAAAKLIPYTTELQRQLRRAVAPWVCDLYGRRPRLALGSAYWSISPLGAQDRGEHASGIPVGFAEDAEYLGGGSRWLVERALAVPSLLRHLGDVDAFRYLTLLLLLARDDLTLISCWHPSFLTLLLDELPRWWERLLRDLERGSLDAGLAITPSLRAPLAARLRPLPRRAAALRRGDPTRPGGLWPRLGLISCWGDGHAALALADLAHRFPGVEIQPKGLLATEAAVTIPFSGRWPLAIRSHFFELLPSTAPERPRFAWELEAGETYSVVVTTGGGLYRYRLGDRVRVDGFVARTPSLRFLGKEGHVSDLFGEKLHEAFVGSALARACARVALAPRFALLAPAGEGRYAAGGTAHYALYVESPDPLPHDLASVLDDELAANPHYRLCRDLGQLARVSVVPVGPGATARYLERCRRDGQRLGDVKPLALSGRTGWGEALSG